MNGAFENCVPPYYIRMCVYVHTYIVDLANQATCKHMYCTYVHMFICTVCYMYLHWLHMYTYIPHCSAPNNQIYWTATDTDS